jgi:hypothetical protein
MITPRLLKLSPLDWYKLLSSVAFVVLGGFIIIRFLSASSKRYVTPLIIGGLIFAYGLYRLIAAYRNLHRLLNASKESPKKRFTR